MKYTANKTHLNPGATTALLLAITFGLPAVAQNASTDQNGAQVQTGATANGAAAQSTSTSSDANTSATGKPLPTKSNEGFWGHMNPLARKKWVNRQIDPVKGRLNELDELQSKNASDIKDVDGRAQAGIHHAQSTADQANQLATTASGTASQAQQTAQQATERTSQLGTTISNIDQYQQVSDTEINFKAGQTVLNSNAKDALDQLATKLQGQKGYVVEVEGYSHSRGQAGIQNSQHMADAVVRYLVEQHQVPVYRIHQVAMGNAPLTDSTDAATKTGSVVKVVLMQNSLAALNSPSMNGGSPNGATQQSPAQPSPQGAASQPAVPQ